MFREKGNVTWPVPLRARGKKRLSTMLRGRFGRAGIAVTLSIVYALDSAKRLNVGQRLGPTIPPVLRYAVWSLVSAGRKLGTYAHHTIPSNGRALTVIDT